MAILEKIKYGIDVPRWQRMSPMLNAHAAGGCLCVDKVNDITGFGGFFQLASAAILNVYIGGTNGHGFIVNPGISAFGAGAAMEMMDSFTYTGSLGAGCSTTKLVTATTFGATVPLNALSINEYLGLRIRVIGNHAGGSGLIEERYIVGNTSSTTPVLYLNEPLSFTPASGDTYEVMAGKTFILGSGATGATQFRHFSVGINAMTSLTGTGLTIATESDMVILDEQFVPYDRRPGEGFHVGAGTYDTTGTGTTKQCLTATAIGASSITGEVAAGDYGVIANEYRNFQIRIVDDVSIPTAVNQRRIIASHTAGPSAVYTLGSAWSVTPSATAKFVIENPNLIILTTVAAGTATYTYNPTPYTINNGTNSINANAWSTTYFGARGTVMAAGSFLLPSYGHRPATNADGTRLSRHSYIYSFRGGGTTTLDMLDIAGGTTGAWTNAMPYAGQQTGFNTGSSADYAPVDQGGQWGYITLNGGAQVFKFNVKYQSMYPWATLPLQAGTAVVGKRIVATPYMTPAEADKMSMLFVQSHLSTDLFRCEVIV